MSKEAMKQALEALEINLIFLRNVKPFKGQEELASDCVAMTEETITSLRQAIAEAEKQEPVAHTAIFHCPNCEYPHRQVTHITGTAQPPWSPQRKEQGPVAWMCHPFGDDECEFSDHQECENCIPLYTTPPQRTWVGLTDEDDIDWDGTGNLKQLVEAVEAKLKEKNTRNGGCL